MPSDNKRLGIFLPTLWRAERLERFIKNLIATTSDFRLYIICWEKDPETVVESFRLQAAYSDCVHVIINENHNYSQGVNLAYALTDEPFIYLAQDDLEFPVGWLDPAYRVFSTDPSCCVVETPDKNTDLAAGWLLKRSYIKESSGVFDKPDIILNPDYDHYFCDTEFIHTAKFRGVYIHCCGAWVIHKTEENRDATHERAMKYADKDKALYAARRENFKGAIRL